MFARWARSQSSRASSEGRSDGGSHTPAMPVMEVSPVDTRHARLHSRASSRSTSNVDRLGGQDANAKEKTATVSVWLATQIYLRDNWIAIVYSTVSLGLLLLLFYLSFFAATMTDGTNGKPEVVGCRSWAYGGSCGLWGIDCRPFETEWSPIRCRARCSLDLSSSLAVYGSGPYRGDSRICKAAIHAGVIGHNGGCALLRYSGAANSFEPSTANGITTEAFASWFPKTMVFKSAPSRYCTDLTWTILAVGIVILTGFAFVPRTNVGMLFALLVGWGFIYVRLIGQPPSDDYTQLAINCFGEVFVLLAASSWLYSVAPSYTFARWYELDAKHRALLWGVCYVLPFHVLINMNMFQYVPWLNIDFGGYEEGNANAGTYIMFGLLGCAVLFCTVKFARNLYRLPIWRTLVVWYTTVVTVVLISWACFPSTDFHLHHTMLGAFLIPLTRFPTPLAAAAQSAALGCFIQGYAAWGWSSYLDTIPTYLTVPVPDDPPEIVNITSTSVNISWAPLDSVDGYSVLLNNVEVYRGIEKTTAVDGLQPNITYFATVVGVANWGTDGRPGPESNFTTLMK